MTIVVESVTLENVKSYGEPTTIDLGEGVTAIIGENGAGKSTIQEAIGFALFDTHPFSKQDRMVRDGESSGHVEVTFRHLPTDRQYTVRRWAGRSKYDVLDENGDALGLGSTSDVKDWIAETLSVDNPDDLSGVWRRSIGVPQTNFLADFTRGEAGRVDTFDPLFDIERYRRAYKSLSGLKYEFDDDIQEKERRINELRGELADLSTLEETVDEREAEVARLTEEIEEIEADLEEIEDECAELEDLETQLEETEIELQSLEETRIPTTEEKLADAEDARDDAKAAADALSEVEDDHEAYVDASSKRDELQDRQRERQDLRNARNEVEAKIDRLEVRVDQLQADVETVRAARERMDELEPQVETFRELSDAVAELEDDEDRLDDLVEEIAGVEDDLENVEEACDELEATLEEANEKRSVAETVDDLRDERQRVVAERTTLEKERDDCRDQIEELQALDIGEGSGSGIDCPTCDREITVDHRETVVRRNEDRISEIETEALPALEERLDDLDDELERARAARDVVTRIPDYEAELEERRDEIDALESELESLRAEREELTELVAELPDKRERQESLADVESEYDRAKVRYEDNEDAETKLESVQQKIAAQEAELEEFVDQLEEFVDLDDRLADLEETIETTQEGYETYLQRREEAEKLDDRNEAVDEVRAELESLRDEADDVRETIDRLETEFDADRLEELESERSECEGEKNRLIGKRDHVDEQLEKERRTLNELYVKRDTKNELKEEVIELERDKRFAAWARNTLQQGASDLRELITTEIGHRANEIFQQLRGNPTETLVWDKTYNVRVRVKGQDKPFDSLSGGEKMAAALAIRLAILERLASVGVAFLDEPTANLDTEKRRNLVNQLESLDGLTQLTVISHDRTFEAMTERAIELEKDELEEVTRVVSD